MKRFILGSLVLVIVATGIAQAGHIDLPVKWSQLPQLGSTNGRMRAEHPEGWGGQIVADDWLCTDPAPVVAVRWWGSYLNTGLEPTANGQMVDFEIVFHSDDPLAETFPGSGVYLNSQLYPYSTPLAPLGNVVGQAPYWNLIQAQQDFYGTAPIPGGGGATYNVYEYNAYLEVPFPQVEGIIYWIDIEYDEQHLGETQGTNTQSWAWNTSLNDWNDKAVYGPNHSGINGWTEFVCHNMAFELMVPVPAAVILGILGLGVAGIKLRKYA